MLRQLGDLVFVEGEWDQVSKNWDNALRADAKEKVQKNVHISITNFYCTSTITFKFIERYESLHQTTNFKCPSQL